MPVLSAASKASGCAPRTQALPALQRPVADGTVGSCESSSVTAISSHWLCTQPVGQPVGVTHHEMSRRFASESPERDVRAHDESPPGPSSQPHGSVRMHGPAWKPCGTASTCEPQVPPLHCVACVTPKAVIFVPVGAVSRKEELWRFAAGAVTSAHRKMPQVPVPVAEGVNRRLPGLLEVQAETV